MKRKISISDYAVEVVFRYAESLGIDAQSLRSSLGFEANHVAVPTSRVPVEKFLTLWDVLVTRSADPHFGLHFGERFPSLMTGGNVLHTMLANCDTVEQALDQMTRYQYLGVDFFDTQVCRKGDYAYRVFEPVTNELPLNRHHFEAALCISSQMLRILTRGSIRFTEVHFTHPAPIDISEHQRIFGCPVRFRHPRMELAFNRDTLGWCLPMANARLARELESLIHAISGDLYRPDNWTDRVRHQIGQLLWQGERPRLEVVASNLAISSRQLQYRLKEEATSFQALLDQCREEVALRHMNAGHRTLGEIATLLGFSGQSAFNHAFKRWTGVNPRHYGQNQMGSGTDKRRWSLQSPEK